MTLKQQIGQMVVVRASGYLFDHQIRYPAWEPPNAKLRHWLETLNLGGVILLGGSAAELILRTQQLQSWATTPLLIAADIEEGVGQRFTGATWFPPPMALGAIAQDNLSTAQHYATQMGSITAQEALAIGINWLLAPIVDVNNNPNNPVINVRSFGDNPEVVSQLATAFIQGANGHCVLTTAKHFPGHGDTANDSHLDLPIIPHDTSRLAEVELVPFEQAIKAGVDSIMTAHLLIPAWDKDRPATLSPAIVTEKLRHQLGFEGLIVTDALIMGGVANYASPEEVAVMAVEAGADILLMPQDPEKAIEAIYQAVQSGRLTPERISQSVDRIWQGKQKIFNNSPSLPSLYQLSQPPIRETVKNILRDSLKTGGNLPLKISKKKKSKRNLIVVDDLLNSDFLDRQMPAMLIPKQLGYELQLVDQNTLSCVKKDDRMTLLQIFIRGNPFRGKAGLTDEAQKIYHHLFKKERIEGLIIYGSPYVLEWFKTQFNKKLPWVFSYGQMADSQAIACQTLFDLQVSEALEDTFI